jgi:hypothetical protein
MARRSFVLSNDKRDNLLRTLFLSCLTGAHTEETAVAVPMGADLFSGRTWVPQQQLILLAKLCSGFNEPICNEANAKR